MNIFLHTFVKINMIILLAHYEIISCKPHLVIVILYEPHMPLGNGLSSNKLLFCCSANYMCECSSVTVCELIIAVN